MENVELTKARILLRQEKQIDSLLTQAAFTLGALMIPFTGVFAIALVRVLQVADADFWTSDDPARAVMLTGALWVASYIALLIVLAAVRSLRAIALLPIVVTAIAACAWLTWQISDPRNWSQGSIALGGLYFFTTVLALLALSLLSMSADDKATARRPIGASLLASAAAPIDGLPGVRRRLWASIIAYPFFVLSNALAFVTSFIIAGVIGLPVLLLILTFMRGARLPDTIALSGLLALMQSALVIPALIILLTVTGALLYWIAGLLQRAARFLILAGRVNARSDKRPYILLLRSFSEREIKVPLRTEGLFSRLSDLIYRSITFTRRGVALDPLLIEEFSVIGPTVALAEPGTKHRPFGAERVPATHEEWQGEVLRLAQGAAHIVIVAGDTPGTLWEIEQLTSAAALAEKTLILAPPAKGDLRSAEGLPSISKLANGETIDSAPFLIGIQLSADPGTALKYWIKSPDGDGYQTALQRFFSRGIVA